MRCERGSSRRFDRWASSRSSATSSPATISRRRGSSPAPGYATSSRRSGRATARRCCSAPITTACPSGPGASDDGIGVATLLEVGSILKDRPLKRPVILLFNEGEELGLIGARAFLADPLSRNVDSVLNFEARGVTGRRPCSRPAGRTAPRSRSSPRAFARPFASSLSTDVYRLHAQRHRRHDFYKERGWLTLNFAIDRQRDPLSQPRRRPCQPRSAKPSSIWATRRWLYRASFRRARRAATGQRIFMDVLGRGFVQMPQTSV